MKGGAALVVMALNMVTDTSWLFRAAEKGYDDAIIPKYKMITERVHAHGAKIFCQLAHLGRQSMSTFSKLPLIKSSEADISLKKYKPEQIVMLLRQVAVELANGKTTPRAYKDTEIAETTLINLYS